MNKEFKSTHITEQWSYEELRWWYMEHPKGWITDHEVIYVELPSPVCFTVSGWDTKQQARIGNSWTTNKVMFVLGHPRECNLMLRCYACDEDWNRIHCEPLTDMWEDIAIPKAVELLVADGPSTAYWDWWGSDFGCDGLRSDSPSSFTPIRRWTKEELEKFYMEVR